MHLDLSNIGLVKANAVRTWGQMTGAVIDSTAPSYPDPQRDIASYMTVLGLGPSLESFMAAARAQSRFSYKSKFSSTAVRAYVREGFGTPIQ